MIRIATEADIPAILDIYAPYIITTTHTFEYTVPPLEVFTDRFRRITAQFPWLVWEENGTVLGYAYGSAPFERAAYAWSGELSIYLDPRIHGRGIGRLLYDVLEAILFRQGYRVIYAIITSENTASQAFHRKLGYQTAAQLPGCAFKFGRSLGILWMEKRSDSVEIPTQPPVPWTSFVESNKNLDDILANLTLSKRSKI